MRLTPFFTKNTLPTLLLGLSLVAGSWAQGMFDLFTGDWSGKSPAGQAVQLHTNKSPHEFELRYGPYKVRGEYKVTANKGQPHVSFTPSSIEKGGKACDSLDMEQWSLEVGKPSRAILSYRDKGLGMSTFGPESEFYYEMDLNQSKP